MKRVIRNRRLTREEAAGYKDIREKISKELPDLIDRHNQRMAALDQLQDLLLQLKAAREAKGLSLSDLTELTGMDRSALSKLETGQRANPTVETLVRYAQAVGKRLVVKLAAPRRQASDDAGNVSAFFHQISRGDAALVVIAAPPDVFQQGRDAGAQIDDQIGRRQEAAHRTIQAAVSVVNKALITDQLADGFVEEKA